MSRKLSVLPYLLLSLALPASVGAVDLPELGEIDSVSELAVAFNAHRGSTRLVLLLSPT